MDRYFRKRSTNQWLNAVLGGVEGSGVPASSHISDLARALGIPESDLEAVDSETDVRTGTLLDLPTPPPPPPSPDDVFIVALEAATTLPGVKAALLNWVRAK